MISRKPPYDRPPLSKQVLSGQWEPGRAQLRPADRLSTLDVEFLLGDAAVALDVRERTVHTASGRALTADEIVLATGLRPRTFPGQSELRGVHVLRTLDDALTLRANLLSCSRAVVVGDGVLGTEIAASTAGMGVPVTLTGPQPAPLASQFGPLVSDLLAELHASRGVGLRLGAAPATEWLEGSGLALANGVVCDSRCRAAQGVHAVGDVARWQHETLDVALRLENRTNATEQAGHVAAVILGDDRPYTPVPYFWTDQFDTKIHVHGTLFADAEVSIVEGSVPERRFVAEYRRNGVVTGVLGWNMPKQARLRRPSASACTMPVTW